MATTMATTVATATARFFGFVPAAEVVKTFNEARGVWYVEVFDAIPALGATAAAWWETAPHKAVNAAIAPVFELARDQPMLAVWASLAYVVGIFALKQYMRSRDALQITPLVAAWDLLLCVFSAAGMMRTVPHLLWHLHTYGWHQNVCGPMWYMYGSGVTGMWLQLFVLSKYAELLDTVLLILKKRKVIFLHWFHHAATLMFCWHAYGIESSLGLFFCAMNYSVHALMYGYYFLAAVHCVPKWFPVPAITVLQVCDHRMPAASSSHCAFVALAERANVARRHPHLSSPHLPT
uniref:Elongation of fatty acids protein n=1 Tax=Phaeomonas parva TaxID=124430 RepID=A0A7S1TZ42_9STRA